MATDSQHATPPSTERRQAVWPWLLMPVVVLVVFFILWKIRDGTTVAPPASGIGAGETATSVEPEVDSEAP